MTRPFYQRHKPDMFETAHTSFSDDKLSQRVQNDGWVKPGLQVGNVRIYKNERTWTPFFNMHPLKPICIDVEELF